MLKGILSLAILLLLALGLALWLLRPAPHATPTSKPPPGVAPPPAPGTAAVSAAEGDARAIAAPGEPDPAITVALDAAEPIERRLAAIETLAARRESGAAPALLALAGQDSPLRAPALAALGGLPPDARVARRLHPFLDLPDPQALAAVVRALARHEGAGAVTAIAETLRRNRRRPDGYEDTVCGACVEALGATGSPAAIPILAGELEQTVGRELQHEYGSQVVAALCRIGGEAARPPLAAYRERLRADQAAQQANPLGQRYLDGKIAEVSAAIDSLAAPR